jgi:hypothetical protein
MCPDLARHNRRPIPPRRHHLPAMTHLATGPASRAVLGASPPSSLPHRAISAIYPRRPRRIPAILIVLVVHAVGVLDRQPTKGSTRSR